MIDRDLVRDKLSSDNRALWEKLQYRFRHYIEDEMIRRGDMSNDELNAQIKPLIIHYQKNYAPFKKKTRSLKRNMTM